MLKPLLTGSSVLLFLVAGTLSARMGLLVLILGKLWFTHNQVNHLAGGDTIPNEGLI